MKRFYNDVDKVIQSKAIDLYRDCCVELIESNGLKDKAVDCAIKICKAHIDNEDSEIHDSFTTLIPTLKNIIKRLMIFSKEPIK